MRRLIKLAILATIAIGIGTPAQAAPRPVCQKMVWGVCLSWGTEQGPSTHGGN